MTLSAEDNKKIMEILEDVSKEMDKLEIKLEEDHKKRLEQIDAFYQKELKKIEEEDQAFEKKKIQLGFYTSYAEKYRHQDSDYDDDDDDEDESTNIAAQACLESNAILDIETIIKYDAANEKSPGYEDESTSIAAQACLESNAALDEETIIKYDAANEIKEDEIPPIYEDEKIENEAEKYDDLAKYRHMFANESPASIEKEPTNISVSEKDSNINDEEALEEEYRKQLEAARLREIEESRRRQEDRMKSKGDNKQSNNQNGDKK